MQFKASEYTFHCSVCKGRIRTYENGTSHILGIICPACLKKIEEEEKKEK